VGFFECKADIYTKYFALKVGRSQFLYVTLIGGAREVVNKALYLFLYPSFICTLMKQICVAATFYSLFSRHRV
jgi:hypothetical protein